MTTTTKTARRIRNRQDKAAQRKRIREWIIKQTGGRITTAEGYVMELIRKEAQS